MSATDQTLRFLVSQVGIGDHAAFRYLYAMLAPATLAAMRGDLPDVEHSMHVVRATFIEVWHMCAFDARCGTPRRDVATWVAAIAERRCDERCAALDWAGLGCSPTDNTVAWFELLAAHDRRTRLLLAIMLEGSDMVDGRLYRVAAGA